jgi:hypothetical protein
MQQELEGSPQIHKRRKRENLRTKYFKNSAKVQTEFEAKQNLWAVLDTLPQISHCKLQDTVNEQNCCGYPS